MWSASMPAHAMSCSPVPEPGIPLTARCDDVEARPPVRQQAFGHGRSQPAFGMVVLRHDDPSGGGRHGLGEGGRVNRFDRVAVDDSCLDPLGAKQVGRFEARAA